MLIVNCISHHTLQTNLKRGKHIMLNTTTHALWVI